MKPFASQVSALVRAVLLSAALFSVAQADVVAGRDYQVLPVAQPIEVKGKVEVIEFFSFGCPHCAHYEPYVEAWAAKLPKTAVFRREHVNFSGRSDWAPFAKLAIALKMLGKLEAFAPKVFDAVHNQHLVLQDESVLFDWAAKQGLPRNQLEGALKSFGMQANLKRAEQYGSDYKLEGVPMFIVNGKYVVTTQPGDNDGSKMFGIINQLVAKETPAGKAK